MRVWQAQRFLLPQGRVILIFPNDRLGLRTKPGEAGRFTIFIFDAEKDSLLNFSETGEPGTDLVARIGVQSGPMSL